MFTLAARSRSVALLAFALLAPVAGCSAGAPAPVAVDATATTAERPPLGVCADVPGAHPLPDWLRGATVYGVVPKLFGPHPLQDVARHLDDLRDLGVGALWISPVTRAVSDDDFGYVITDELEIRPDYGTEEDLRALVREAHARGIRMLLDIVPNHTSDEHPWFRDVRERGEASPFFDWYDRDERGVVTHYFDWVHLPNLNLKNPAVADVITRAFLHFVREFDFDGFRVDAAWGIEQRTPAFWPRLAAELRRERPDAFLLAEAGAHDSYWIRHGFDAVYDWSPEIGHWAWEGAFDDPDETGARLFAALTSGRTPAFRVARFLDNNDTGARFVSRYGVEPTRVAAAMLLTLPGVPIVYTGDEVGAEYEPYDRSAALVFDDRHGLRAHYRKLIRLRAELPGLASSCWTPIPTPEDGAVLAYVRHEAGGANPVLVVLSFGDATRVRLALPEAFDGLAAGETLWDALHDAPVAVERGAGGTLEVAVEAHRALVLTPPRAP